MKTNTIRAETRTGIPARTKCGGDVTKYLVEIRQGDAVAIPPEEILAQSRFESPNRLAKCGEKGIRPHVAVYGVDLMSKKAGLRWRLISCEGWRGVPNRDKTHRRELLVIFLHFIQCGHEPEHPSAAETRRQ